MNNKKTGKEVAQDLFNSLNILGGEKEVIDEFVEEFKRTHRTLQQGFGRLLLAVIAEGSRMYSDRSFDARNESFCIACYFMHDIVEEKGLDYLPLI